jgi:hypothetical protein
MLLEIFAPHIATGVPDGEGAYTCCKYFQLAGKNASMAAMLVVSIIFEAAVAVIAVLAARAGRPYLYGLAFTFTAYVLYDLARLLRWPVEGPLLSGLFLLATITVRKVSFSKNFN